MYTITCQYLVGAQPDHSAREGHVPALGHSHVLHAADEIRPQPPRVHLVACTSHNVIICLDSSIPRKSKLFILKSVIIFLKTI